MALTCSSADPTSDCPLPNPNAKNGQDLASVRAKAGFPVVFPCILPAGQEYDSGSVTGVAGQQQVELVFIGPFDLHIRQSQIPPAVNPDPSGASKIDIDLFPNVSAILIERYDGSKKVLYHLFWNRDGIFYELQAVGPPLQRAAMLDAARSLQ